MKKKIGEHVAPIVQLPYINSKDNVAKQLVVVKQTIMIKRSNTAVIEAGSMDTFPHGEWMQLGSKRTFYNLNLWNKVKIKEVAVNKQERKKKPTWQQL